MAEIIIFEGISTCGKTTVQGLVYDYLRSKGKTVLNIGEENVSKTFLPESTPLEISKTKLNKVFSKNVIKDYDYILFDRCHFSNIMMYNCEFDEFEEIDNLLAKHKARIVWLYFSPSVVVSRVRNSLQHREGIGFERYIKRLIKDCKNTQEENKKIYSAYKKDIDTIDYCFEKTTLEYLKIDVSNISDKKEYPSILSKILNFIQK